MARLDIKGQNNALHIVFHEGSSEELLDNLRNKLETNRRLFTGSPVLFQGDALQYLTPEELIALQRLCLDFGMFFTTPPAATLQRPPSRSKKVAVDSGNSDIVSMRTLRSGQKAHSDGTLLIWGDVHESAEISAAGDIIVLGRLDGVAHAGCYGDRERCIFALSLYPKQLRIANFISRSSGEMERSDYPEMAYLHHDAIYVRKYNAKEGQGKK